MFLDVAVPEGHIQSGEKVPVLVWIYGGGVSRGPFRLFSLKLIFESSLLLAKRAILIFVLLASSSVPLPQTNPSSSLQ